MKKYFTLEDNQKKLSGLNIALTSFLENYETGYQKTKNKNKFHARHTSKKIERLLKVIDKQSQVN